MALYKRNNRVTNKTAAQTLQDDFSDMLIGPTCGETADRLAKAVGQDPLELALRLKNMADRYLASCK